jgi:CheY-like chemotaxis protein
MSIHQKVLLVDDDVDDQYLFTEALKTIYPSIECMIANNGQEAISQLASCSSMPTLIFLDLNMPLMNGFECMAELKKNIAFKHLPIVIYTTSNKIMELKRITELGAKAFLAKLSNFNILKNELAEIFEMEL